MFGRTLQILRTSTTCFSRIPANRRGTTRASLQRVRGVRRFTDLRAWQACDTYKKAVYRLCDEGPLSRDHDRRRQLEESAKGPPAHVAEGFGRFNPLDFARFVVMGRASLMESQNHLRDAVDKGYISEQARLDLDTLAEAALGEVTGLVQYLQSPEAQRNARRARERRIASRPERQNIEPQNIEPEPRTERRTEPRTEPEHEPGTENPEQ
jgi:four helix bundle protein